MFGNMKEMFGNMREMFGNMREMFGNLFVTMSLRNVAKNV